MVVQTSPSIRLTSPEISYVRAAKHDKERECADVPKLELKLRKAQMEAFALGTCYLLHLHFTTQVLS